MELPTLKLQAEDINTKVIDVLSPLYIDDSTCKKLVAVFEDEIEKGIYLFQSSNRFSTNTFFYRNAAWFGKI